MDHFQKIQRVIALLQKNFECPICLELMKNPVSTKCGHQFCNLCAQNAIRNRPVAPCPMCKDKITKRSLNRLGPLNDIINGVRALTSAFEADTGVSFAVPPGPILAVTPIKTPQSMQKSQPQESINKTDDSQANKNRKRPRDRKSDCESILSGSVKRRSLERKCKSKEVETEHLQSEIPDTGLVLSSVASLHHAADNEEVVSERTVPIDIDHNEGETPTTTTKQKVQDNDGYCNNDDKNLNQVTGAKNGPVTEIDPADLPSDKTDLLQQWVMSVDRECHPTPQNPNLTPISEDLSLPSNDSEAPLFQRRIFKSRQPVYAQSNQAKLVDKPSSQRSEDPYSFKSSQKTPKTKVKKKSRVGRKAKKQNEKSFMNRGYICKKQTLRNQHQTIVDEVFPNSELIVNDIDSIMEDATMTTIDENVEQDVAVTSIGENVNQDVTEIIMEENEQQQEASKENISKNSTSSKSGKKKGRKRKIVKKIGTNELTFSQMTREEVAHLENKISEAESFDLYVEGQSQKCSNEDQAVIEPNNAAEHKPTSVKKDISQQWRAMKQMSHDLKSPAIAHRKLKFVPEKQTVQNTKDQNKVSSVRLISNAAELSDYDEEDDVLIDNETAHDDEDGFYGDKDNRFTEDMVHAFDDKRSIHSNESLDLGLTQEAGQHMKSDFQSKEIKGNTSHLFDEDEALRSSRCVSMTTVIEPSCITETTQESSVYPAENLNDETVDVKFIPEHQGDMDDLMKDGRDIAELGENIEKIDSIQCSEINIKDVSKSQKGKKYLQILKMEDGLGIEEEQMTESENDMNLDQMQAVTDQVIYPKQVESNSLTMKPQRDCFVVSPDNRPLLSKKLGRKTFTLGSSPPNLNSSQSLTTKTDANDLKALTELLTDSEMLTMMEQENLLDNQSDDMDVHVNHAIQATPTKQKFSSEVISGTTEASLSLTQAIHLPNVNETSSTDETKVMSSPGQRPPQRSTGTNSGSKKASGQSSEIPILDNSLIQVPPSDRSVNNHKTVIKEVSQKSDDHIRSNQKNGESKISNQKQKLILTNQDSDNKSQRRLSRRHQQSSGKEGLTKSELNLSGRKSQSVSVYKGQSEGKLGEQIHSSQTNGNEIYQKQEQVILDQANKMKASKKLDDESQRLPSQSIVPHGNANQTQNHEKAANESSDKHSLTNQTLVTSQSRPHTEASQSDGLRESDPSQASISMLQMPKQTLIQTSLEHADQERTSQGQTAMDEYPQDVITIDDELSPDDIFDEGYSQQVDIRARQSLSDIIKDEPQSDDEVNSRSRSPLPTRSDETPVDEDKLLSDDEVKSRSRSPLLKMETPGVKTRSKRKFDECAETKKIKQEENDKLSLGDENVSDGNVKGEDIAASPLDSDQSQDIIDTKVKPGVRAVRGLAKRRRSSQIKFGYLSPGVGKSDNTDSSLSKPSPASRIKEPFPKDTDCRSDISSTRNDQFMSNKSKQSDPTNESYNVTKVKDVEPETIPGSASQRAPSSSQLSSKSVDSTCDIVPPTPPCHATDRQGDKMLSASKFISPSINRNRNTPGSKFKPYSTCSAEQDKLIASKEHRLDTETGIPDKVDHDINDADDNAREINNPCPEFDLEYGLQSSDEDGDDLPDLFALSPEKKIKQSSQIQYGEFGESTVDVTSQDSDERRVDVMGIAQNKTKPARGPNMTYSQQQVAILNNVQADLDLDREVQKLNRSAIAIPDDESEEGNDDDEEMSHPRFCRKRVIRDDDCDNESDISDTSEHQANLTSTSARSSQSEILSTQQQAQLRSEMELINDQIAELEAKLEHAPEDSIVNLTLRGAASCDLTLNRTVSCDTEVKVQEGEDPTPNEKMDDDDDEQCDNPEGQGHTDNPNPSIVPSLSIGPGANINQDSCDSVQSSFSQVMSVGLDDLINQSEDERAVSPLPPTPPTITLKHQGCKASPGGLKLLPGVQKAVEILDRYKTQQNNSQNGFQMSPYLKSADKMKKENDGSDTFVQQTSSSSSKRKMTVKYTSGLSVIASGLTVSEKEVVSEFVKTFGGKFSVKFEESTTHVIVKAESDASDAMMCQRTLKYFQGLAAGAWIISVQWASDCLQSNRLLPEISYEMAGDVVTGIDHQGPQRARQASEPLLAGYEIYCHGEFTAMTKEEVCGLARSCGAEVVTDLLMFNYKPGLIQMIVAQQLEHNNSPGEQAYDRMFRGFRALAVSREWLLDSLCQYQVQDVADYTLCSKNVTQKWRKLQKA